MLNHNRHALLAFHVLTGCLLLTGQLTGQEFNKGEVRFKHFSGWTVTSDKSFSTTRLIIVHGPDNAIVTIQFSEDDVAGTLKEYASEYSKIAAEATKSFRIVKQSFGKPEKNKAGFQTIAEHFTLVAKDHDEIPDTSVPHKRVFMKKKYGNFSCYLVTQSATVHLEKSQAGFDAIVNSLKRSTF